MSNKKPISKKDKKFLIQKSLSALENISYYKTLKILESYYKKYDFDDELLYHLGMLYDHLGQVFLNGFRTKPHAKKSNQYFNKAIYIFNKALKFNHKSYRALYGIGKVYRNQKKYEKALQYSKKAYKIALKEKAKSVYGIGFIYEMMGKNKDAERWYLKEIKDRGINDFAVVTNYIIFSNRVYRQKMDTIAEQAFKLYKQKSNSFKNSVFGREIKHDIDIILYKNNPFKHIKQINLQKKKPK